MLSWILHFLIGSFLIAHGLHWRFDMSRSWLGVFGFPILHESWRSLAVISASVSLLLLVLTWHPWLTLGVLIDAGILVALLWGNWLPES